MKIHEILAFLFTAHFVVPNFLIVTVEIYYFIPCLKWTASIRPEKRIKKIDSDGIRTHATEVTGA